MKRSPLRYAFCVITLLCFAPAEAQSREEQQKSTAQSELTTAEAAVAAAEAAGAPALATSLYDEAMARLRQARAGWNADRREDRENAILRAVEARHAARAAEAQAMLVAANSEIRNLRTDIANFGGTAAEITLYDPPGVTARGITSADRVIVAETAIRNARAAGGDQVAGEDLARVERTLETARTLAKRDDQSASADHLAFVAEMTARRAESVARRNALAPHLPAFRVERTRLAQEAANTRAREEESRRLQAEREAAELRRQLDLMVADRQAEQEELDRLRQQVTERETEFRSRLESDRAARVAAEQRYDELLRRYEAALVQGGASTVEVEQLRRQVEDQSLALRSLQDRERQSEVSVGNQISSLEQSLERERAEGKLTADVLAQREQELRAQREELQRLQSEREENERRRRDAEAALQTAVAEAERRRNAAEAQSEQLRQQVAAERARAEQTEAELTRAREELARRDAAARERIDSMQRALSELAATRTSERGFIVTLPGLFFDTGKSVVKTGARNTLSRIADQLRINDQTRIAIEGHTDSVGSEELNQGLSEKRAEAVRDYLVSRGVPAERITVRGFGETSPVATNDTAAGRQQNRRVELVITQ
jgi:outer membrane protein OmpA-like peptidoglycan-associated protein